MQTNVQMIDLKINTGLSFYGEALPKQDILQLYKESDLQSFLKFANTSCGKWMVIDTANKRLITNPGYTGGYIDVLQLLLSDNLRELISGRRSSASLEFNEGALQRYITKGSYYTSYTYPYLHRLKGYKC